MSDLVVVHLLRGMLHMHAVQDTSMMLSATVLRLKRDTLV